MHTILNGDSGFGAARSRRLGAAYVAARQLIPGSAAKQGATASVARCPLLDTEPAIARRRQRCNENSKRCNENHCYFHLVSKAVPEPTVAISVNRGRLGGVWGAPPMVNKGGCAPWFELVAALSAFSMMAPRKGRGGLLSDFASEVSAPCSILRALKSRDVFRRVRSFFYSKK
jgi:hypothetical protein